MGEKEKLQKAIETSIAAGYQIDCEAFDFLSFIAATDDPTTLIIKAIQRIEELEEKPMFIGKSFLQQLSEPHELSPKQSYTNLPTAQETNQEQEEKTSSEGTTVFHPYAKDVVAKIDVIDDPTGKFSSNGTIEDYIQYFQTRFKRLEHLLRQRIDVKPATPILEALKSPAKTKLKIICMITEKREAKQNTILTVEDLQGSATILVTHNAPAELHKKAQMLIPDQVVCIAVAKTRIHPFPSRNQNPPKNSKKP